jgi:hypothetical protein
VRSPPRWIRAATAPAALVLAAADGTVAVDLGPLSLLCRLVALVPAPRFHTVRYYAGVLAAFNQASP